MNSDKYNISRRRLMQSMMLGGASLCFGNQWSVTAGPAPVKLAAGTARAKAVIQVWMWGGISHLDTFDPKPDAGNDYCGSLKKTIETGVKGIQINESLPLLAAQMDKYSIIRSMTHGINGHETASYMVQTGRQPGDGLVYPAVGAVVSLKKGYDAGYNSLLPPYVVATEPLGRFSEAGFLGAAYKPFATGGDPAKEPFTVEGVVAPGITEQRQKSRRELMHQLDQFESQVGENPSFSKLGKAENDAYELILGETGKVFDLTKEAGSLRDKYGRNSFGQACLLARRLVERGVLFVSINYKGWDTHKQHFSIMKTKLPEFDMGLATLLQDLSDKKLLDSTIVWCSGEFGRTPRVQWDSPWNGGRGHYGKVFSAVVAGGGFIPGRVVGSTDDKGETVKDRPVYPGDLIGSMYQLLGIDPNGFLPHPQGRQVRLIPSATENATAGGLLKEIMQG